MLSYTKSHLSDAKVIFSVRKLFIIIILLSSFSTLNSFAQTYGWYIIDVPSSVPNANFTNVKFIGDNVCLTTLSNNIYEATNGGATWTAQTSNTSEVLEAVYFTSLAEGYAVGANNTILKFGELSSVENEEELPREYSLSQNYPNPFNPSTKIRFAIPQTGFASLKVYDVLENEITILVNEEKPTGEYEVEFSGNGLTSGVYFYQLKAGSFIETKKMVLLR